MNVEEHLERAASCLLPKRLAVAAQIASGLAVRENLNAEGVAMRALQIADHLIALEAGK